MSIYIKKIFEIEIHLYKLLGINNVVEMLILVNSNTKNKHKWEIIMFVYFIAFLTND